MVDEARYSDDVTKASEQTAVGEGLALGALMAGVNELTGNKTTLELDRQPGIAVVSMRNVAPVVIALLVVSMVSGCQSVATVNECPAADADLPQLTQEIAQTLTAEYALMCRLDAGSNMEGPTEGTIEGPWADLLATDGLTLPALVTLSPDSQTPADCRAITTRQQYVLVGTDWYQARAVVCHQDD